MKRIKPTIFNPEKITFVNYWLFIFVYPINMNKMSYVTIMRLSLYIQY